MVFVRELTGGIYFGEKKITDRSASDICEYSKVEIERITRVAANIAQSRRKKISEKKEGGGKIIGTHCWI